MSSFNIMSYLQELGGKADATDAAFFIKVLSKVAELPLDEQEYCLLIACKRYGWRRDNFFIELKYIDFLFEFIKQDSYKKVAILHPDIGFFTKAIAEKLELTSIDVVSENEERLLLNKQFCQSIKPLSGNFPTLWDSLQKQYDLIISFPPMGVRNITPNSQYPSFVFYEYQVIVEASKKLKSGSHAAFVVSPSLFYRQKLYLFILDELRKNGCNLKAAIAMPNGFYQHTQVAPSLIIIEKAESKSTFVSKFPDKKLYKVVVDNFQENKNGKKIEQGKWFESSKLRSFSYLEASEELEQTKKELKLQTYKLGDIADVRPATKEHIGDKSPNVFFTHRIPSAVNLRAILEPHEKGITNLIRIEVKSIEVDFDYLMLYFQQSPYINLAFSKYSAGVTIQHISNNSIKKISVFLPDLATQKKIVLGQNNIQNLKKELDSISDKLWQDQTTINKAFLNLKKNYSGETEEAYLHELHFPLASILNKVRTTPKDSFTELMNRKINFFEAMIEYLATILMSAISQSPSLCHDLLEEVFDQLKMNNIELKKSSIGTWVTIYSKLAKEVRLKINSADEDDKEWAYEVFKTRNGELINTLVNKNFASIMQSVMQIRNKLAHSGEISPKMITDAIERLDKNFNIVKSLIRYICDHYTLIRATKIKKSGKLFTNTYEKMHGSNYEFESYDLKSSFAIDTDCLTLLENQSKNIIELLPFVVVRPSELKIPACYFYTRTSSDGKLRFISYSFTEDPEIVFSDLNVSKVVNNNEIC